jgi:hypothetical protein
MQTKGHEVALKRITVRKQQKRRKKFANSESALTIRAKAVAQSNHKT